MVSQPAAAVTSMMKPTVICLASLLALSASMPFASPIGPRPPQPLPGHRWPWVWFPKLADEPRSTKTDFQKKHIPLVRLKKDMDVLRLKKDVTKNWKRDMDILRLKKSIPEGKNNEDR